MKPMNREESIREFNFLQGVQKFFRRGGAAGIEESNQQVALDQEINSRLRMLKARIEAPDEEGGDAISFCRDRISGNSFSGTFRVRVRDANDTSNESSDTFTFDTTHNAF